MPEYDRIQNPAAHSQFVATRVLSHNYAAFRHMMLLLWPGGLSVDWSVGSVQLVESWADSRNLLVAGMYAALLALLAWVTKRIPVESPGSDGGGGASGTL